MYVARYKRMHIDSKAIAVMKLFHINHVIEPILCAKIH